MRKAAFYIEMHGRWRGDAGEMQGRCRGDAGEVEVRCRGWMFDTSLARAVMAGGGGEQRSSL